MNCGLTSLVEGQLLPTEVSDQRLRDLSRGKVTEAIYLSFAKRDIVAHLLRGVC